MSTQRRVPWGWSGTLSLLIIAMTALLNGCGTMSEDERAIAVAVALTQTAAAIETDTGSSPIPTEAATTTPPAEDAVTETTDGAQVDTTNDTSEETNATDVPASTPMPAEPTAAPTVVETPVAPTVAAAGNATDDTNGDTTDDTNGDMSGETATTIDQLTTATLPVTQNSLKVRTLLVAPGEPGALYALLTDAPDDTGPAIGARFLISRDFGRSWSAAPSGLPVAENCLVNINMDYYGPTALYASTCQGIYRWAEGSDWTLVSEEQTGMVAVVYGNDNLIWATRPSGVEGAPVLLSQNGGTSWQEIAMTHTNGVAAIGISPRDSQSGYAIVWPGGDGSYLRRGSIVQEWRLMPAPGNALPLNPGMTIDGGTGWLYVTTAEADGDRLWRSTDPDTPIIEDVSWNEVYRFASGMTVDLLASGWSSEEDKLAIYANLTTELPANVGGQIKVTLIRSTDNGVTWEPLIVDAG